MNRDEYVQEFKKEFWKHTRTVEEVAQILGIKESTVMKMLRDKRLIGWQVGRTWHVEDEDLWRFKSEQFYK